MTNILILGANGQIAQLVRQRLLTETDAYLTLYLRQAKRLGTIAPKRETVVEADVNDYQALVQALANQDIVYANLGGQLKPLAQNIVTAMTTSNVQRLIYVTGLGLYHQTPDNVLTDTCQAAQIIATSSLAYTIIRAANLTNTAGSANELAQPASLFAARNRIADLIMKVIVNPEKHRYSSLEVD